MKHTFYTLIVLLVFFSCKKHSDSPIIDNSPNLSLDSLKTLSTNIPEAVYSDLVFTNEVTGYAITQGFIAKTTDAGNSWQTITLPINTPLKKIQFTDSKTGYIIGGDNTFGVLLKTVDGGETWTAINLNTLECPYGMFFLNNKTGFITGKNFFSKTTDGGQTWLSLKSNSFRMFQDVNFKNSSEGFVTSSNGVYFKTTDGGVSWDSLKCNSADYLYDIYFTGNKILVVNADDNMVDLAHNYQLTLKPASARKLLFLSAEKCVGVGFSDTQGFYPDGNILITNDGWATYQQKTFSLFTGLSFTAIAKMTDDKVMILGVAYHAAKVMVLNR